LEPDHPWIGVQELLNLGIQTRKIRLGVFQLIAENAQTDRSSGYRSPTAPTLIREGHQFLGSRAAVMRYWLRS
jgi:hypothetical protein